MKNCLHVNDARRGRMRRASEIARQKSDRARKFGTPKPRVPKLVPIQTIWPQMSRRERVESNLMSFGGIGAIAMAAMAPPLTASPYGPVVDGVMDLIERKILEKPE